MQYSINGCVDQIFWSDRFIWFIKFWENFWKLNNIK